MAKEKQTTIQINDKEYIFEEMTQEQQLLVNHVADLDRKIGSAQFNLDQMKVGKEAFMSRLQEALKEEE
jgi:uncharacterized protein YlzI (FlbEa/FlbD family)